ncbi:hypothetical protein [Brachybacterium tyrofermentans]|uniref:Uncharacterized protein n=2 Tax=Brachybacterium tyrofermentans TaxID=47848 RepID=A0ABW0FKW8_9MICO
MARSPAPTIAIAIAIAIAAATGTGTRTRTRTRPSTSTSTSTSTRTRTRTRTDRADRADPAAENSFDPGQGPGHAVNMGQAQGFEYATRRDGAVVITHHGTVAAVLRGRRAEQFLDEAAGDPQGAMARWTGNYQHGNERTAKQHPRNRTRH